MKRNVLVIALMCSMSVFFLSSRSSALMVGLSTKELTRTSEVIIQGEVERVKSYWSKDRETIFTNVSIVIRDIIKGKVAQNKIEVEHEGGEIGNKSLKFSDEPTFKKGEKVILFLETRKSKIGEQGKEVYNIVGCAQGKYTIGDDGIARKTGFSITGGDDIVDNNISLDAIIDKIKEME